MSSIYKHLSKADLKIEKEKPALLPTEEYQSVIRPNLSGIKIAIVLSFLFAFAAFAVAVHLFQTLNTEKAERRSIEQAYTEFGKEAQIMKGESEQYRLEMEKMQAQVKKSSAERASLEKEVNRSRIEISNLEKKVRSMDDQNVALQNKIQALRDELSKKAVPAVQAFVQPAAQDTEPAQSPPAQVNADVPVREERTLKQVMTVNRKFNFVVINLGMKDNLKMGDRLFIERDGQAIGTAEVEKLYDNFAAATILDERSKVKIQEGDQVRKA